MSPHPRTVEKQRPSINEGVFRMKKLLLIAAAIALASLLSAAEAGKLVFVPVENSAYIDAVPDVKTRLVPKYKAYLAQPANKRQTKAERVNALIARYAPEWQAEFRKHNDLLGWEEDAFAVLCLGLHVPDGCTSWVVLPPNTADGKMLLHKCRDNKDRDFAVAIEQLPGRYRVLRGGRACHPGVNYGLNEKGLCAVVDAGDDSPDKPNPERFGSTIMQRLVLEQCATIDEGVALLQKIVDNGHCLKGQIFLLADTQKAALFECSPRHWAAAPVASGFHVIAGTWKLPGMFAISSRDKDKFVTGQGREWVVRKFFQDILAAGKPIGREDVFAISRLKDGSGGKAQPAAWEQRGPFCKTSISGATLVPDREFPGTLSTMYLALGPQLHSVYLPIPIAVAALPVPLLDASWGHLAFAIQKTHGDDHPALAEINALERKMLASYDQSVEAARTLLRQGKRAGAEKLLNENFRTNARLAWDLLNALAATSSPYQRS
jgi:hypothetical protein